MKIVQFITRMDVIGGAQIHVRDISVGLNKSGHDIYILAGGGENVHDILAKEKIRVVYSKYLIRRLSIVSDIKAFLEIRKILKEIKPDIIAAHSSKAGVIGRIAGWSLQIPTIFTAHGWSFTEGISIKKKLLFICIEKVIGRISCGVIAVSEFDRQLALKYKVLPESKVYTIHNGVHDIDNEYLATYSEERPKIIMVARFDQPKRQLQLLIALNQLQHIKWEMYFAGNGPLLIEAQDYVEREGLGDRVYFLGNRKDITNLLRNSNVFALLSDWEGLPLSVLEAMRSGLPIIASDVGGVSEAVVQSKNGFIIPKSDFNELLNKLTLLLTDPTLCRKMGENGRLLYEENFTYEHMYKSTVLYYKKIIQLNRETLIQTS